MGKSEDDHKIRDDIVGIVGNKLQMSNKEFEFDCSSLSIINLAHRVYALINLITFYNYCIMSYTQIYNLITMKKPPRSRSCLSLYDNPDVEIIELI